MGVFFLNEINEIAKDTKKSNKEYSIEDFALVRITNGFPHNHVVQTPKNANVMIEFQPESMWRAIIRLLKEKYKDEFVNYKDNFKLLQLLQRDTVHFCLNGLVSDHNYGSFDGDYVIIDSLSSQVNNDNLCSLRVEDTYFRGDVNLSDKASIIISKEQYEKIKNDPIYTNDLLNINVFVYEGINKSKAVEQALNVLGYRSFQIDEHGYQDGADSKSEAYKAFNFIQNYCRNHNIESFRHINSPEHSEEKEMMRQESIDKEIKIFEFICNEVGIQSDLVEEMKYYIQNQMIYNSEFEDKMFNILNQFGLDRLQRIILEQKKETLSSMKAQSHTL